ncbi:M56 family metallopeptidase [Enterococcus sp. BWB1-3]|uniref:M56 family metallopeptidase n=1 Tax=Enterococcus sp. BWB1-3 TaxID=2787713 RepID=UPI0019235A33|nr:M56 family metallopeptidase [Enterococcus sp. BWB1-3]MBL1229971.1 M56 family metallopeptidase [Enterococcus sp. BWB1-3]
MHLSLSSFMTFQFGNSIILILIFLLMRYLGDSRLVSSNVLYIFSALFILRLVIPFEFFHTITLPSRVLLPAINKLLAYKIVTLWSDIAVSLSSVLLFVWLFVLSIKLIRFIKSYSKIKSFSRLCSDSDQIHYKDKSLKILFVDERIPPSVIGVFSPIIVLPKNCFTDREKELILSHELTHISNFDLYIKYVYSLISIIYWWNPLIYLFRDRMDQILEIRVDSNVIHTFDEAQKIEYVETLIKVSKLQSENQNYSFNKNVYFNFSSKSSSKLLQRSKCILSGQKNKLSVEILMGIIVVLFFLSSAVIFEPYAVDRETESVTYDISTKNSFFVKNGSNYDMYVNGEYIISYESDKIPKEFEHIKQIDTIEEE